MSWSESMPTEKDLREKFSAWELFSRTEFSSLIPPWVSAYHAPSLVEEREDYISNLLSKFKRMRVIRYRPSYRKWQLLP